MRRAFYILTFLFAIAAPVSPQKAYRPKHTSVLHMKFSPDASKLISYSSGEQALFLWDIGKRRLVWARPISFIQKADDYYTLNALAWSPDGKFVATGSGNGTVQLWDVSDGSFIWRADIADRDVTAVVFSSDGQHIAATSSSDKANAVKVLNASDGALVKTFAGNPCTGIAVAIDDISQELRVGNLDGDVATWNLKTGDQLSDYATPCREMRTYDWNSSFSKDLSLSAKQTSPDEVVVRNNGTSRILISTRANDSKIKTAVNSVAQKAIISEYGGLRLYDLKSQENRLLKDFGGGHTFDLSDDGKLIAQELGYKTAIRITNLQDGNVWYLDGKPVQSFKPGTKEIRLKQERDARQVEITNLKKARDAEAAIFSQKFRDKIYITFEHYGDMSDRGSKRLLETNEIKESSVTKRPEEATAVWLRLHNDSPLPIQIPTESMYLPDPKCFHSFPTDEKLRGLCVNREIGVWFEIQDKNGKSVPYGFDFGSSANLLPNSSVIFPVPITIWNKGYSIVFEYSFQNVRASKNDRSFDYGEKIQLRLAKQLMEK